jgi:pyruvate,water dikinase
MTSKPNHPRSRATLLPDGAPFVLGICAGLCASISACGSQKPSEPSLLSVSIVSPLGSPPPSYRLVVSVKSSEVWVQSCPGSDRDDGIRCTDDGFAIEATSVARKVTIKAPGNAWQTAPLAKKTGDSTQTIELEALPTFEQNDDYATGLSPEDGLETFDSFAVPVDTELGPSRSVKFIITDLHESPHVYLQNTRRHPLHYDFARTVLGRSQSITEFEKATYSGADRDDLAGTLVFYPELEFESEVAGGELGAPMTLNFFPSDSLSPEHALVAFRLLEERLLMVKIAGSKHRLVYVPAGERQRDELDEATRKFAEQDALWTDAEELYAGIEEQVLNPGLAYGTLRLFTPDELERAVVSSQDIVVLTRLPNDLPLVGGTITAELQTPLAHVNVAARARGTPNLALRNADTDPRVTELLGRLVRFEVTRSGFTLDEASEKDAHAYWDSQTREPFTPAGDSSDHGLPDFDEVGFAGASYCGPKAANLSELRQLLGEEAPPGFVVPFWAYDQHMSRTRVSDELCQRAHEDCVEEGRDSVLCVGAVERCSASASADESLYDYAERLIEDGEFGRDTAVREACLDSLVYVVSHAPVDDAFGAKLDARLAEVFGEAKVRLRSSTNAEDLPNFSGAGLYESKSAWASGADAASKRIGKVWASVWGFKAFEERRLWSIDHLAVRMGVAVNLAYDDEQANGVLITQNITNPGVVGMYVNVQLGEVSVTNPDDGALPEVFSILPAPGGGVQVARQRLSSLSPDAPLLSDEEVAELYRAAARVQTHFAPLYDQDVSELALDLEFKFHGPERALIIKQARPYAARTASSNQ